MASAENQTFISSKEGLILAMEKQATIEVPVFLCDASFDLHVSLGGGLRGIIPREEVRVLRRGEIEKDIAILTRVGKPCACKVMGFRKIGNEEVAILSRRAAQTECYHEYIAGLRPGDIVAAKVTHLENFGAFLDIGCGIVSLLSIDNLSVSRIDHPSRRLSVGQTIYTVIKNIDQTGRIYTTERELFGTWEENATMFSEGQTVRGIVRSVESYGIFVELAPNLAGLAEYRSDVCENASCAVYIKSVIPEKMKIKLILIDVGEEEKNATPITYFTDPKNVSHIDFWQYSPCGCAKNIYTDFSDDSECDT